ncbi:MAG: putative porin, partial [Cellvibrio sp.]
MKLKLLVAALGVAVSGFAIADSYQAEVSAGASRTDYSDFVGDVDRYNLEGKYYFNSVNTANVPLAEAAYLGKNSNVFASVIDEHNKHTNSSQHYRIGAEFYIPENFLYVQAGVIRNSSGTSRESDWFTAVGITPIDGLLLTTMYVHDAGYDA